MTPAPGDLAICGACGFSERALRLPVFVVTGAAGSGKTALRQPLIDALPECAVFDANWLYDSTRRMSLPDSMDWTSFRDAWLAVAHGVAQGGRATVLIGTFLPSEMAVLPARRWIGDIHFAALDCADDVRLERLASRSDWRRRDVDEELAFASLVRSSVEPAVRTDSQPPDAVAAELAAWVRSRLAALPDLPHAGAPGI
jgi:hypothetical protein